MWFCPFKYVIIRFIAYISMIVYSGLIDPTFVFQVFALAGLGSGLTEAFVINPFEVIKVKLQAERNQFKEVLTSFYLCFVSWLDLSVNGQTWKNKFCVLVFKKNLT